MDYNLEGKLAFVTGSTKGIGKATADLLLREGAEVIIHGRTKESVERAKEDLPSAHTVFGDLRHKAAVEKIIEDVKNIGAVQILVNNAGIYEAKAFQDIADEDWLRLFDVNVMSGVRFSRALLPPMLLLNWGRIIFVSSESAISIPKEMIHYGMTKTAQLAISRGLAELTRGTQVTVNTVAPGPTASEGVVDFVKGVATSQGKHRDAVEQDFFKTVRPTSLLQRFEDPMEIAQTIVFLASPLSSAINGALVRADGGIVKSAF
ncbi:MAG TPA: SDR family oxidoreductase [Rhodomicrobium sp.]|nr:SDR family oxidoreductase [Rhodomicrobium sp.]